MKHGLLMRRSLALILAWLAAMWDVRTGRIPNPLAVTGLAAAVGLRLMGEGFAGFPDFLLGSSLPFLLLWIFFYFRMLGAGDIKLLCVIGGLLGVRALLSCMAISFLLGGIYSLVLLIRRRIFLERFRYFFAYIGSFYRTGKWVPYRNVRSQNAEISFAIFIFLSVFVNTGRCL